VLRALSQEGEAARMVLAHLVKEAGDLPGCAEAVKFIQHALSATEEAHARAGVERLALLAVVAALRTSVAEVAPIFARCRLAAPFTRLFGAAELAPAETALLLERALPLH